MEDPIGSLGFPRFPSTPAGGGTRLVRAAAGEHTDRGADGSPEDAVQGGGERAAGRGEERGLPKGAAEGESRVRLGSAASNAAAWAGGLGAGGPG